MAIFLKNISIKTKKNYCGIDDQSKVELSLINYESHFILEDPVISLPSDEYLNLLLQLKLNSDRVILKKENDFLFELIKELGSLSESNIISDANYKFNLKIPMRLIFCF